MFIHVCEQHQRQHSGMTVACNNEVELQELHMTGCMLIADDFCLVIAEGSQKSHKKYSRLMLNRINWNQSQEEEQQGQFQLGLVCFVTATKPFHNKVASIIVTA